MRKWSPEPLREERSPARGGAEATAESTGITTPVDRGAGFRPEFGDVDQETFLRLLSREEREQLYQLVEADVAAALGARHEAQAGRHREEARRLLAELADSVARENAEVLGTAARAAVDLALEIARRILRREMAADSTTLVRAVELLLLRLAGSVSLRLTVNPADAAWLREQPELLARLRVVEVDEDRRIERGGCRIQSDQREWDATLRGQLSALEEAIVASLEGGADARQGEEEDERGADHLHPVG